MRTSTGHRSSLLLRPTTPSIPPLPGILAALSRGMPVHERRINYLERRKCPVIAKSHRRERSAWCWSLATRSQTTRQAPFDFPSLRRKQAGKGIWRKVPCSAWSNPAIHLWALLNGGHRRSVLASSNLQPNMSSCSSQPAHISLTAPSPTTRSSPDQSLAPATQKEAVPGRTPGTGFPLPIDNESTYQLWPGAAAPPPIRAEKQRLIRDHGSAPRGAVRDSPTHSRHRPVIQETRPSRFPAPRSSGSSLHNPPDRPRTYEYPARMI